ncbi:DUF3916 domain-containing protein [Undibacterium sp. JH2W]|uniref:DUF3916 domain-containing protein n=1 Tax=Undibacterium sp. JH2W TaxID=3413037 RepID=UPI003BF44CF6
MPVHAAEKKLRGIPRRLRALHQWSDSFKNNFPAAVELAENSRYWNWKIPADWAMLEGRQSTLAMKREIACLLLQACEHLIKAKPAWARSYRVTCLICLPQMFASEICIYLDEAYFQSKISVPAADANVSAKRIHDTSLSQTWQLPLSEKMKEIGIQFYHTEDDFVDVSQYWMFGELG